MRPHRWLTAATILFAIGLLSSVDAEGQTADFVGDDDDDAETLSASLEATICQATLSQSHDPIGVRSHHKQFAVTPSPGTRRPARRTHLVLPAPRVHFSGNPINLIPSRAPPSR
jgi:hypothetical protein